MAKASTHVSGAQTVTTTSETVVASCPALPLDAVPSTPIRISGVVNITAGTGTTAVVVKIRQGNTVGGTQVGVSLTHTLAAGASGQIAFDLLDSSFISTGYCVTVTQTGASGNGTINDAAITAELGSY